LWYNESYFPVTVGEDQYFACGDNRNHSWDSRYQAVGVVDREEIVGRALLVLFPFSDFGLV
jgi:signal peptidase I